jgi:hypothetical protein
MSFPKHCICVMFIDMPVCSLTGSLPLLYLPLKRTKRYFKHFVHTKGNKNLYVRFSALPRDVQHILQLTWQHLINDIFVFLNPETDELLGEFSLEFLTKVCDSFVHKRSLKKWLRIILRGKRWERQHPVYGKYAIVYAFLFHFAVSAVSLKKQFRLFSGKTGETQRTSSCYSNALF